MKNDFTNVILAPHVGILIEGLSHEACIKTLATSPCNTVIGETEILQQTSQST